MTRDELHNNLKELLGHESTANMIMNWVDDHVDEKVSAAVWEAEGYMYMNMGDD